MIQTDKFAKLNKMNQTECFVEVLFPTYSFHVSKRQNESNWQNEAFNKLNNS